MLAAIGFCVALLGWTAPAFQQADPSCLLPAGTVIYFGTDSVQAGADASRKTALAKILNEAEVRAFLHQPLGAAEGVLKALLRDTEANLGRVPGAEKGGEWLRGMVNGSEPSPVGRAFVALTHVSMPEPGNEIPDIGLVLGIELLDPEHVGLLRTLWNLVGDEDSEQTATFQGIDYFIRPFPDTPLSIHLAFVDRLAILTLSKRSLEGVLALASGKGESLAGTAEFAKLVKASGGLRPGTSTSMVRVASLVNLLQTGLMMAAAEELEPQELLGIMQAFSDLGLQAIQMVGATSYVASDGLIHTTSVAAIDPKAPGLVTALTNSQGSVEPAGLKSIPGDSLGASLAVLGDQLPKLYDFVMNAIGSIRPDAKTEIEGTISAFLGGSSLRDDILANLHGQTVSYSVRGQGLSPSPDWVLKVGVHDGDALVKALSNLLDSLSRESGMPLKLNNVTHEGKQLHELDLSATPFGLQLQPSFAFLDDGSLLFSTSTRQLKSRLNEQIDSSSSLASKKGIEVFLAETDPGMSLQSFAYTNVAANFKSQYGPLAAMAPFLLSGMGASLPVDFTKLPPPDVIESHLSDAYSSAASDDHGLFVTRTIANFQLGDMLPIVAIGGLITLGETMGVSAGVTEVEVDPVTLAMNDLKEIRAALTVYKIAMAGYPETLDALLEPIPAYEAGALTREELPLDPWGRPYRFTMGMHPTKNRPEPRLWSVGPDGIDDNGDGDDILRF